MYIFVRYVESYIEKETEREAPSIIYLSVNVEYFCMYISVRLDQRYIERERWRLIGIVTVLSCICVCMYISVRYVKRHLDIERVVIRIIGIVN